MGNFKNILQEYADSLHHGGGDESMNNNVDIERSQLQAALKILSQRNNTLFRVCIMLAVLAFILSFGLLIYFIGDPAKIQLIFGATGLSFTGLLTYMNAVWKEKVSTDILLALVGTLKADTINSVVVALLAKI